MHVEIVDPFLHTVLLIIFLFAATLFTAKKDPGPHEMNHSHTNEVKGVAILMVIFSHIGYFLFSDHRFTYPLSVAGGVGVNIFLFLSGFGLTSSELKKHIPLRTFYFKRLKNIFIPMWLVLTFILLADAVFLGRTYSITTLVQAFLGYFPYADIDAAINSPLWYFTLILFYYLVFPLVFRRSKLVLSTVAMVLLGYGVTQLNLPVSEDVLKLYKLHYLAFPIGMIFACLSSKNIWLRINTRVVSLSSHPVVTFIIRYSLIAVLLRGVAYTAINSNVGESVLNEQLMSIVTMVLIVLIILVKNVQSNILILLGKFSYEIYLIQWPLLYRHDWIYKHTPAFLGTLLYLALFLALAYALSRLEKVILKTLKLG